MRKEFDLDRSAARAVRVVGRQGGDPGDLGRSIRLNDPVTSLLAERLPVRLQLAASAMGFALLVSIPLGVDRGA